MPKHILIVDDSKTVRNLVAFIMRKEGFKVTAAEDGLDGLEKLHRPAGGSHHYRHQYAAHGWHHLYQNRP